MQHHSKYARLLGCLTAAALVCVMSPTMLAEDWPMFGRDATRNATSPEKNPPLSWDVTTSTNLKWKSDLGWSSMSDPVVSGGLVWIGTNNHGFDPTADASVLACFREADGAPLYRYVSPRLTQGYVHDWPAASMACSPLVEGDRLWFVTNRCEVVCLDIAPLRQQSAEPKVLWKLDMLNDLKVFPRGSMMHLCHLCSVAGYRDWIYVSTGNGVDQSFTKVPQPEAPSLLCLEKQTGRIVWQDSSPGENILLGQWSSPLVAEIDGLAQVIMAQGDGWIRSFDAAHGKLLWMYDINPKQARWSLGAASDRRFVLSTPVLYEGKIYVTGGNHPESGDGPGRLICIDPSRQGDISKELAVDAEGRALPRRRTQAVDATQGEKAIANSNSGLIWEFTASGPDFTEMMHVSSSNVAIAEGLVIAPDYSGMVHCFDARTGTRHWAYDVMAGILSSPLIVDGHAYVSDEDGRMLVFRLSADPAVATPNGEPLAVIEMGESFYSSPIYANGVLYAATRKTLHAIETKANPAKPVSSGYWPEWRGPARDNISRETGLLADWPEGGPPLKWRVEGLGNKIDTVSIADGRVYTSGRRDGQEYAVALDEATGEFRWARALGAAPPDAPAMRWLTQRAPTVDDDRVYYSSTAGDLLCLRVENGGLLWRRSYPADFGGVAPPYGFADHPMVVDHQLICLPCSEQATVVALDRQSGREIWRLAIKGDAAGYAAPIFAQAAGINQILIRLTRSVISVRVADGKLLWQQAVGDAGIPLFTPILRDRYYALIPLRGKRQLAMLPLTGGLESKTIQGAELSPLQDTALWTGRHLLCGERRELPLAWDVDSGKVVRPTEEIYPSNDTVSTAASGIRRGGSSSFTLADNRLYFRNSRGEVALLEFTGDEWRLHGHFSLTDHQRPAFGASLPVVAGGSLYLRDEDRLFCYDVRRAPETVAALRRVTLPAFPPPIDTTDAPREPRPQSAAVFVPTPADVVEKMVDLADLNAESLVVDLGSGDGRILIAAAKRGGVRAIGYEIDKELVSASRQAIQAAELGGRVRVDEADLFTADLSQADVVFVYLPEQVLGRLRPQFAQLKPGARIISHYFPIPNEPPEKTLEVQSAEDDEMHVVYRWVAPLSNANSN